MLITETRHSDDSRRIQRLINRAITALGLAGQSDPSDPELGLALAEAHILRFQLSGQTQDLLAANIELDRLAETQSPPQESIATLRALLSKAR